MDCRPFRVRLFVRDDLFHQRAIALRRAAPRRHQPGLRAHPDRQALALGEGFETGLVRIQRERCAHRSRADVRVGMLQQMRQQALEILTFGRREELERIDDHFRGRMVEDQTRNQIRMPTDSQNVHRSAHTPLFRRVQRLDQGTRRGQIEFRHIDLRFDRAFAEGLPKHIQVGPAQRDRREDPGAGKDHDRRRNSHPVPAQGHQPEQQHRSEGLRRGLPHDVDGPLDEGAKPRGHGQIEQLRRGFVERIAERAVHGFQKERGDETAAEQDPGRGQSEQ